MDYQVLCVVSGVWLSLKNSFYLGNRKEGEKCPVYAGSPWICAEARSFLEFVVLWQLVSLSGVCVPQCLFPSSHAKSKRSQVTNSFFCQKVNWGRWQVVVGGMDNKKKRVKSVRKSSVLLG